MVPHLSSASAPSRHPRILLADRNVFALESLIHRINEERIDFDYDVALSHDSAVVKIFDSPPPYQCIISSVPIAERDNFFLLKHNRGIQPDVPFILTTGPAEIASARRAIDEGAFDLLPTPLEPQQTAHTIRLALWHNKLKGLMATRERVVDKYRQHLAAYPRTTENVSQRSLAVLDNTISTFDGSIQRVEESLVCFSRLATSVEQDTRIRALNRLYRWRK